MAEQSHASTAARYEIIAFMGAAGSAILGAVESVENALAIIATERARCGGTAFYPMIYDTAQRSYLIPHRVTG
jgi:hypothetical protein